MKRLFLVLCSMLCSGGLLLGLFTGFVPVYAAPVTQAPSLTVQEIQSQAGSLYERLHYQKASQAAIDAAMLNTFGLQRVVGDTARTASPFTSTNQDVSLPTSTVYQSHGYTYIYSSFSWNCGTGAYCSGDPPDFYDVFGAWFSRNENVNSTYMYTTDQFGNQTTYFNPTNFSQAGADYSAMADFWVSGTIQIVLNGGWPSGCNEVFTKYTHGWSSVQVTSVTLTTGFPPSFGISVTYGNVSHSWQATGGTPYHHGC
jgi:hypothetical protein